MVLSRFVFLLVFAVCAAPGWGWAGMPAAGVQIDEFRSHAMFGEFAVHKKLQRTIRFTAHVIDEQGERVADAVVVTSAGGKAVTDMDGRATLDVVLSEAAQRVYVTAALSRGGMTELGSVSVDAAQTNTVDAGIIVIRAAADCQPEWVPAFGARPGVDIWLRTLAVFDDGSGSGPALYAGGFFSHAGGVAADSVAKWDGTSWSAVGGGMNSLVDVLVVFDDGCGGGPALYAGGGFTTAGGAEAIRIAKWDGTSWSTLGSGLNSWVKDLVVFDDGSGGGPALYASGDFTTAGGVEVNGIAKWDGTSWSALGSGMNDWVHAMCVFDDGRGGGPALYAGGDFTTAGGAEANRIAKWDGTSWSALGSGCNSIVFVLQVFHDGNGSGPALYAGGQFTTAGGVDVNRIAKWDGTSWSAVGRGMNDRVSALTIFDDGSGGGPALYAGGSFTTADGVEANRIAKWDGTSWLALGAGMTSPAVHALTFFDDGSGGGSALFAGGWFMQAGSVQVNGIAKWDGRSWSALGDGTDDAVWALAVFDDGSGGGPELYAGGDFTFAGGEMVNRIAKWDGTSWSALRAGMNNRVSTLAVFDDGSGGGPALYAGGSFTTADGVSANRIAKWDGSSWSPLGSGMGSLSDTAVWALAVFDDGSGGGPELFAGGRFRNAGNVSARGIAKWDGTSWSAVGRAANSISMVNSLIVFDDGSGGGPALYAGVFVGTPIESNWHHVAKWNGASWSTLGSGMNSWVHDLTIFDDGRGGGPALYAGGSFSIAGGVSASAIAKWDGTAWSPVGSGRPFSVYALTAFDDGSGGGAALFAAGGDFINIIKAGVETDRIAKWDGTSWSPLGAGIQSRTVLALAASESATGGGPALYAGGTFIASPGGDSFVAKWQGCPTPNPGDLNRDGVVDALDMEILFVAWGTCPDHHDCPADLNGDGVVDSSDLLLLLTHWG